MSAADVADAINAMIDEMASQSGRSRDDYVVIICGDKFYVMLKPEFLP